MLYWLRSAPVEPTPKPADQTEAEADHDQDRVARAALAADLRLLDGRVVDDEAHLLLGDHRGAAPPISNGPTGAARAAGAGPDGIGAAGWRLGGCARTSRACPAEQTAALARCLAHPGKARRRCAGPLTAGGGTEPPTAGGGTDAPGPGGIDPPTCPGVTVRPRRAFRSLISRGLFDGVAMLGPCLRDAASCLTRRHACDSEQPGLLQVSR